MADGSEETMNLGMLVLAEDISEKKATRIKRIAEGFRNLDDIDNTLARYLRKAALTALGGFTIGCMRRSSQETITDYLGLRPDYFTRANLFLAAPLKLGIYLATKYSLSELADLALNNPNPVQAFTDGTLSLMMLYGGAVWTVRTARNLWTSHPSFSPTTTGILSAAGYQVLKHSRRIRDSFSNGM